MAEEEAAGLGSDGGESNGTGQAHVGDETTTERVPASSWHGKAIDVLNDEQSLLTDAFNTLRPGLMRRGLAACVGTVILHHLGAVRRVRAGIEAEAEAEL